MFTQNITVTYSKRRGRFVQYSNAIRNALESQYLDSYSRVDYPVGKSFINDLGVTSNPSYVDITAFYNFFQESVEAKYQDESTIEQEQIPNFYSFFLNEEPEVPSDLLLSEPSPVAPTLEEPSITPTPSDSPTIISDLDFGTGETSPFTLEDARLTEIEGRDPIERARESRGRPETVIEALEAGIRRNNELVRSRYNRVFLMSYDVGSLTEISKNKALFPMYVDIEFSMDPTTEFAECRGKISR